MGPATLGLTRQPEHDLALDVWPDLRIHAFGAGPEAVAFTKLCAQAGYEVALSSPDPDTLAALGPSNITQQLLPPLAHMATACPPSAFDAHTAVALFFHDHGYEPAILTTAAQSPAFYIGAQGSRQSRARRDALLQEAGVSAEKISQMKGPAGLFLGARDARALAVSVLAEILATAQTIDARRT